MKKIKTFLTIDTLETFGMISFTSGTENTSLDHLTTFAAFFKGLNSSFNLTLLGRDFPVFLIIKIPEFGRNSNVNLLF